MNPAKVDRRRLKQLTDLPNIGPATAQDLLLLGYTQPHQLAGANPLQMYRDLCARTQATHDPCVLDVFISITRFMNGGPPMPWWAFTAERKCLLQGGSGTTSSRATPDPSSRAPWRHDPDPPHMHIDPLGAADVARYRELMLHAYAAAPDAFTSTAAERAAEPHAWWLQRVADPSGLSLALGAVHDGRLVGTVTVEFSAKPKTRHKAKLIGMFVDESCRGLGAGAALVRAALAAAGARPGVRVVVLTMTQGNAPAIGLYTRCGFRPFGVEPMAIATEGGYQSKVHMWLPLGAPGAA